VRLQKSSLHLKAGEETLGEVLGERGGFKEAPAGLWVLVHLVLV